MTRGAARTLRALMLVSVCADAQLRGAVTRGDRPRPEYLVLEEQHGVNLFDWSQLRGAPRRRSVDLSLRHVLAALPRLRRYDVVLSDGEHLGIPLALARRALRMPIRHVVIGHRLTSRRKRPFFTKLGAGRGMSTVVLHSSRQLLLAERELGLPPEELVLVPYCVDTAFWRQPRRDAEDRRLLVSAGREHRDYSTLAAACPRLDCSVFVAAGSLHSPTTTWRVPAQWPPNFTVRPLSYRDLRDMYARAAIVVVPLLETDFQAGVTTILEAMAMGKPVIVSATRGQRDIICDRETGILVAPGDPSALREAIMRLLDDTGERQWLGATARHAAEAAFSVELYARRLAAQLVSEPA